MIILRSLVFTIGGARSSLTDERADSMNGAKRMASLTQASLSLGTPIGMNLHNQQRSTSYCDVLNVLRSYRTQL